jgi:hypothetical protein
MPGEPPSTLGSRLGLIVIELALVAAAWWLLHVPLVLAAGLAAVIVVSGLLPDRWNALVTGSLMLAGAAVMDSVNLSGDRRFAMFIGAVGLVFVIVGVLRLRRSAPG